MAIQPTNHDDKDLRFQSRHDRMQTIAVDFDGVIAEYDGWKGTPPQPSSVHREKMSCTFCIRYGVKDGRSSSIQPGQPWKSPNILRFIAFRTMRLIKIRRIRMRAQACGDHLLGRQGLAVFRGCLRGSATNPILQNLDWQVLAGALARVANLPISEWLKWAPSTESNRLRAGSRKKPAGWTHVTL